MGALGLDHTSIQTQAVAIYSGKSYYKAATGYVTTANYVGEVTHEGVESVTYQVTYLSEEHQPEHSPDPGSEQPNLLQRVVSSPNFLGNVLGGAGAITAVVVTLPLVIPDGGAVVAEHSELRPGVN